MGVDDHDSRLARIEAVLDATRADISAMREAILRLVRIEEQQAVMRESVQQVHALLDAMKARMDKAEERMVSLEQARAVGAWVASLAAAALATLSSMAITRVFGG